MLFLLGGNDLEMLTIKDLIIENGFKQIEKPEFDEDGNFFVDKRLQWDNAIVKEYEDFFEYQGDIIAIELRGCENYPGIISIDHHNEKWDNPSAIEQVAGLLGVKLNRWQQLVAVNDKKHIAGLIEAGATEEEIKQIRKADRKAQGVTEEDERLAKESIEKSLSNKGHLSVVESLTEKFSPIADRLFYVDKLIIYNEHTFTYYGPQVQRLVDEFPELIQSGKVYYGGAGERGFFGLAKGHFTQNEIEKLKNRIIQLMEPYSYHIFLFPFRWSVKTKEQDIKELPLDKKTNIQDFDEAIDKNKWKKIYDMNHIASDDVFNRYKYFHDYAREAMMTSEKVKDHDLKEQNILKYQYCTNGKSKYVIEVKDQQEPFLLDIERITLNVYQTGIAVLGFWMENNQHGGFNDILRINEYGRRVWPQFIANGNTEITKGAFLANNLKLELGNEPPIEENFEYYHKHDKIIENPDHISNTIMKLLGDSFHEGYHRIPRDLQVGDVLVEPAVDDRMFVCCHYYKTELAEQLQEMSMINGEMQSAFTISDDWYKFVFIDKDSPSCIDREMFSTLLKNATYSRWAGKNHTNTQLFGFSRYSFVLLTRPGAWLWGKHFRNLYAEMIILTLAQRASVIRFSEEVASLIPKDASKGPDTKRIQTLHREYLSFVGTLYFREVTPQEQGIEMYAMMQKAMNIENEVKDLHREIDGVYQYANLDEAREYNNEMGKLTKIATWLFAPSLVAGIIGMNSYPDVWNDKKLLSFIVSLFLVGISGILAWWLFIKRKNKK